MFKKHLLFCVSFLLVMAVSAQDRYFTKAGRISFTSKAPLEDIEAVNRNVMAVLDAKSGAFQFSVQMKSFAFEKALMEQHFNENYVESDKYPKAEFRGVITNHTAIDYSKNSSYPVKVKGQLSLHNVTKNIEVPGTIKVENGKLEAASTFTILLSDYKISIPSPVKNKVSNSITISVETKLEPLKS